jgi:hypothetical protein
MRKYRLYSASQELQASRQLVAKMPFLSSAFSLLFHRLYQLAFIYEFLLPFLSSISYIKNKGVPSHANHPISFGFHFNGKRTRATNFFTNSLQNQFRIMENHMFSSR